MALRIARQPAQEFPHQRAARTAPDVFRCDAISRLGDDRTMRATTRQQDNAATDESAYESHGRNDRRLCIALVKRQ
jgi:hypothetical protein